MKNTNLLFATKSLQRFCEDNLINYFYFESFRNIIDVLSSVNK